MKDQIAPAFVEDLEPSDPELIRTTLSPDEEDTRRKTFAAEEVPA